MPHARGITVDVLAPFSRQTFLNCHAHLTTPVDTRREINVIMTSKRRRFDVIMTLSLRRVPVGVRCTWITSSYVRYISHQRTLQKRMFERDLVLGNIIDDLCRTARIQYIGCIPLLEHVVDSGWKYHIHMNCFKTDNTSVLNVTSWHWKGKTLPEQRWRWSHWHIHLHISHLYIHLHISRHYYNVLMTSNRRRDVVLTS